MMEVILEVLVHIGNILSVVYNIPQIYLTYKTKSATDISSSFLWMRLASSIIWCIYSIYYGLWLVIVSWTMSLISSCIILYYKYHPKVVIVQLNEGVIVQMEPLVS